MFASAAVVLRNRRLAPASLLLLLGVLLTALPALAQDCSEILAEAQSSYDVGQVDHAILLLEGCLDRAELDTELRHRSYRLIGLCYIYKEREVKARQAVHDLLVLVPDYQADPEDHPLFIELLEEERVALGMTPEEEKSGWMKKALYGAGAVAVGVVALLLGDDGPEPEPEKLPEPPALP